MFGRGRGGWGRRNTVGGRSGFGMSYGMAVLVVSAAILLILYLTGNLAL